MKYAKIENGIVKQLQPNKQDGFVEVGNSIFCGMIENIDGTFSIPDKTQEQINTARIFEIDVRLDEIDKLSVRSLRSKSDGRGNAQDDTKLTDLDDEAIALRTERATLTA